ncbi:hypothetical protein FRC08_008539 [Ceratobasidium sp. 394]|nr:hypothetical protein FRC08_008539 [Ceratobasidium sp. 394]KAG9095156.1 hypothetical protein FS749_010962 [Ceratobasidium sp. UAMH 11750]
MPIKLPALLFAVILFPSMPPIRRTRAKRSASKSKRTPTPKPPLRSEVFQGLNVVEDPNRASVRHVAKPESPTVQTLKAPKRATEGKVKNDMERLLLDMLERAVKNQVVLPFRMEDLRRARDSSAGVKISNGAPFGCLGETPTSIRMADGPRLMVDLNGEIVCTYLPGLIGKGLQQMIQDALEQVVQSCPPEPDTGTGDRRSSAAVSPEAAALEVKTRWPNLTLERRPPGAYYWSCGWYGTGQENVTDITISVPFRKALEKQKAHEVADTLEAKRIYDFVVKLLVSIIHDLFAGSLESLLNRLAKEPGPVGETTRNGWTSLFHCTAFAFNRQTAKHRDSKGCRGGLDVIGVLGSFSGGPLKFQDLKMDIEWQPSCVAAFDGYDLTHEVGEWRGSHRITLISFCRNATWKGLGLPREISHPTLTSMCSALAQACAARQAAITAAMAKQPKRQTGGVRIE